MRTVILIAVELFYWRWIADKNWLIRLPQGDMCQAQGVPPAIKYESDGGPGIADIMKLLMGSKNALVDQDAFMRFQVFQWLIGATDGHGRNFSIFLDTGSISYDTVLRHIIGKPHTGWQKFEYP